MPDPKHYQDIADRYGDSANALADTIHEVGAFAAYHAFESIGAAWLRNLGRKVPRKHRSKLREFSIRSKRLKAGVAIAQLAVLLESWRNKLLYPFRSHHGVYTVSQQELTPAEAKRIVKRVGGVVREVGRNL